MAFLKPAFNAAGLAGKFPGMPGTATRQEKILAVAQELGIGNIEIMQATTRTVYDSLPHDARAVFNFFDGCNARAFPSTNLPSNRLEVGEMMIVESISLSSFVSAAPPVITAFTSLETNSANWMGGQITMTIGNSVVLKPLSLDQFAATTNPYAQIAAQNALRMDSHITIPSLQQFVVSMQATNVTVTANAFVRCTLRGIGVIYRPKKAL